MIPKQRHLFWSWIIYPYDVQTAYRVNICKSDSLTNDNNEVDKETQNKGFMQKR